MSKQPRRTLNDRHIQHDRDDEFGYADYVEPLAQRLFDEQPPFTLGIFGGWGQGKISLMKLLQQRVSRRKVTVVTVWFDAWKFDREDALWRALLAQTVNDISACLDKKAADGSLSNEQRDQLDTLRKKRLDPLRSQLYRSFILTEQGQYKVDWHELPKQLALLGIQSALPGAGVATSIGGATFELIKGWFSRSDETDDATVSAKDNDGNVKEDVKILKKMLDLIKREESKTYFEHIRYLEQFQSEFQDLIEESVQLLGAHRVVFFVDDLDRCEPDKAIEVLEAIKLFLSNERTVFVLGVDDEVIHAGLQRRYGDWLEKLASSSSNGSRADDTRPYHLEYLEKIVQLPFTLPALPEREINQFIRQRLYQSLQTDSVIELIRQGCRHNPRKLNRLCHLLNLNWDLAQQRENLHQNLAPAILVKLVIIQLRHRALYHELLQGRSAIPRRLEAYWRKEAKSGTVTQANRGRPSADEQSTENKALPDDLQEATSGSNENDRNNLEAQVDPWIEPYLTLDWLRELLLWQPVKSIQSEICLTFDDLARSDHYKIEEYIQLKRLPTLLESVAETGVAKDEVLLDLSLLQDLLHEDRSIIESAFNRIANDDRDRYRNELVKFIQDAAKPWRQRVSAGDALGFLGDPRLIGDAVWARDGDWIVIPHGAFFRGSREGNLDANNDNLDGEARELERYQIMQYPVTNYDYEIFVRETSHDKSEHWQDDKIPLGLANHPVIHVNWHDAKAYVDWLKEKDKTHNYDLPIEAQWERAARGPAKIDNKDNRRVYPWEDEFDATKCNTKETGLGRTTAVGCFPDGASPNGVFDLAGNVFEWCADWYDENYYAKGKVAENMKKSQSKVLRGGAFGVDLHVARCAFRGSSPDVRINFFGFRVARMRHP